MDAARDANDGEEEDDALLITSVADDTAGLPGIAENHCDGNGRGNGAGPRPSTISTAPWDSIEPGTDTSQKDAPPAERVSRQHRMHATAAYFSALVGLGFTMSALGPTIPTLAQMYGLSSGTALAPLLVMRGVGYTVGTLGMGRVGSKLPLRRHEILTVAAIGMGLTAALTPTFPSLAGLYIVVAVFSVFGGALDLGCNVLLVDVWSGHENGPAAMNLLHFMWGLGSFLSPLVAEGVGLSPSRLQATWATIGIVSAVLGAPLFFVQSPPPAVTATTTKDKTDEGDGHTVSTDVDASTGGPAAGAEVPSGLKLSRFAFGAAIVALSLYYFCYAGAEHALGDWLATFAIQTLHKSDDDGANLTSVYWACLTLGRLLGAATTKLLSPTQLIAMDFTLAGIGCIILLTWGAVSLGGAYVGAALIGTGLSTLYPMGIMLAERKVRMTGGWISVFISGGTIGSVALPLVVGLLMTVDHSALAWSTASFVLVQLVSYIFVARYEDIPAAGANEVQDTDKDDDDDSVFGSLDGSDNESVSSA